MKLGADMSVCSELGLVGIFLVGVEWVSTEKVNESSRGFCAGTKLSICRILMTILHNNYFYSKIVSGLICR